MMNHDDYEEQVNEFESIVDACMKFMEKYGESADSLIRGIQDELIQKDSMRDN